MAPGVLVVLDGWGHRSQIAGNAIRLAATPFMDELVGRWPHTLVAASGTAVGLPDGVVGNSEIGHLTIGAGRRIEYESTRVERAGRTGELAAHPLLRGALERARLRGGRLHLLGLCSDGMIHGQLEHFRLLLDAVPPSGPQAIFLHPFTDGRDVPDGSAGRHLAELEEVTRRVGRGRIGTVIGRAYTMDRSGAWDRTAAAYQALVAGVGTPVHHPAEVVEAARGRFKDEMIPPAVVIDQAGLPLGPVRDGDLLLFVNFRGDRMRQLVEALVQADFHGFDRGRAPVVEALTLTEYFLDPPVPALFPQSDASGGLADLLEDAGVRNVRIAESEKFPHVTFFVNGRDSRPRELEQDIHVPSLKGADYRLVPAMSARAVAEAVAQAAADPAAGLVIVNLANADVVGHTGDLAAVVQAVETVDGCLRTICEAAWRAGRWVAIVGDHGNAERMLDPESGAPHVGHTSSPVPFLLTHAGDVQLRPDGSLADVGPTLVRLLGLRPGPRMDGEGLLPSPRLVATAGGEP